MATRAGTRPVRPNANATHDKIFEAAEVLFAKEGFDRVTLRQIARDAGQKNVAAVQYHFGSKEGLLSSIVDHHRAEIDARRKQLLADSEAAGRGKELDSLVEILVAPLAEKLDEPSGRAYLRIQAQGLSNETMRPATRTVVQRIGQSIRQSLGHSSNAGNADAAKPSPEDPHRGRLALLLLFHALADRAQQEEAGRGRHADRSEFIASLSRALVRLFSDS